MEPIIITFPAVVKARAITSGGSRLIECEASNQEVDLEGDVIEQKALLDSAEGFIKYGHIDIDHISELGSRVGISNPSSYIIGRPIEVKDLGGKRTGIVGEIMRSRDGSINPEQNKYDEVWKSLQSDPPVIWRASVYGFPDPAGVIDCSDTICQSGATRYHITKMEWKSLALTRNPVNNAIKGCVTIVSAKAHVAWLRKGIMIPFSLGEDPKLQPPLMEDYGQNPQPSYRLTAPISTSQLWDQFNTHMLNDCPHCMPNINATLPFTDHFRECCGATPEMAEMLASALMWMITRQNHQGMM